ncbi:hypothetical protein F2P81_023813 [Scophthalmus maximus]|uniref:Uncharacterized protein n=1 Tax=Scophthalmus maximus TaxID=52904 RepID=A0A6A4RMU8_SCOMX|nr:hypothetical protein F2P81_023813 [Scophthalmus maximus]
MSNKSVWMKAGGRTKGFSVRNERLRTATLPACAGSVASRLPQTTANAGPQASEPGRTPLSSDGRDYHSKSERGRTINHNSASERKWFRCLGRRVSLDSNVTPLGLCPGRGPAVCDGQASGACGGPLLRGFKLALAELCMDERVKSPAMV